MYSCEDAVISSTQFAYRCGSSGHREHQITRTAQHVESCCIVDETDGDRIQWTTTDGNRFEQLVQPRVAAQMLHVLG